MRLYYSAAPSPLERSLERREHHTTRATRSECLPHPRKAPSRIYPTWPASTPRRTIIAADRRRSVSRLARGHGLRSRSSRPAAPLPCSPHTVHPADGSVVPLAQFSEYAATPLLQL